MCPPTTRALTGWGAGEQSKPPAARPQAVFPRVIHDSAEEWPPEGGRFGKKAGKSAIALCPRVCYNRPQHKDRWLPVRDPV